MNPALLARLNPLASFFAPIPAMLVLVFTRNLTTPMLVTLLAMVTVAIGGRLSFKLWIALLAGSVIVVGIMSVSIGIWVSPERTDMPGANVVLWDWARGEFTLAAYLTGLATALRLLGVFWLSLVAGVALETQRLVHAITSNLKVPYRVGYTVIAATRFVPRFRADYQTIRAAHRARGLRRPSMVQVALPLLAGALRHADRVALAMDSRGFGASATRTERHPEPWRLRDTVYLVSFIAISISAIAATLDRF